MVAGAQQQPQPQSQQLTQQSTPSAQDEALKRNTDCVYFLASPLTCKKGSECEYRHSEYARVNPRDCWYWLNGNCLNPKCPFRHPPLDGLLMPQAATAGGSSAPPSQIAPTSATNAPRNSSKQVVPCIFFQNGLCLKGDRCAFLHGPNPNTGNKVPQVQVTNLGTELPSFKKGFGGLEKSMQERKISQENVAKSVGGFEAKSTLKVETASQRNVVGMETHAPPPVGSDNEASRLKVTNTPPVTNGAPVAMPSHLHQSQMLDNHSLHNGKESDEFFRESSPGFDVLVADELRNSDYYNGEDQFGKARGRDGMNLDSVNEYDLRHPVDYKSVADIDQERYSGHRGYDSYDHMQETFVWDQHRNSSEIIFRTPTHAERMTHCRSNSPENGEVSDLRHHLSKRRRVNGLKSVVSHDYSFKSHDDEQGHRFSSRKDLLQLPLNESSLSNRFRGRIKLPANGGDDHLEKELDKGRNRSTLSPGTMQTSRQGRYQDRLRGRMQEDHERKNFRDRPMRKEITGDQNTDFAGPKSLAELKIGKSTEYKEQKSLGKRKSLMQQQQSEINFLFEGPKPLSEILKEKRAAGAEAASKSSKLSDENKGDKKDREITNGLEYTSVTDIQNGTLPETKEDDKNCMLLNEGEYKFQVTDVVGSDVDKIDETHGQSSEDGLIYDEAIEDQEFEGDDQKDGDYDYEQVDEGDYNFDEVENPEQEEYMDDEDGDDFAKKIGVVLT